MCGDTKIKNQIKKQDNSLRQEALLKAQDNPHMETLIKNMPPKLSLADREVLSSFLGVTHDNRS